MNPDLQYFPESCRSATGKVESFGTLVKTTFLSLIPNLLITSPGECDTPRYVRGLWSRVHHQSGEGGRKIQVTRHSPGYNSLAITEGSQVLYTQWLLSCKVPWELFSFFRKSAVLNKFLPHPSPFFTPKKAPSLLISVICCIMAKIQPSQLALDIASNYSTVINS